MKITAIKQQVRRQDRYSVYVDGKYSFSLSEAALLEHKLASGQELDAAGLDAYKQLSADDKAFNRVLRYTAMRARSQGELQDYMRRKQVADETAQQILERLTKIGLVDDTMFARAWVDNRRLLKPVSRRRLEQELRQKHVDPEIISHVLAEDPADEFTVLRDLVARKRKQSKYQDDVKLMQYLARQGFGYDDIKRALAGDD